MSMKWILSYVDVKVGSPLDMVEDKALAGWEPFAITWVAIVNDIAGHRVLESNIQRFWFKKKVSVR